MLNLKYRSFILLLLLAYASSSFCQEGIGFKPYRFPETISENYYSKRSEEYQQLVSRKLPVGISKRDNEKFAQLVSYGKADMFLSGSVYIGWNELESYLNEVAQKIIPANFKGKNNIHIYPTRDATYNASALHDGTIFFNIGLLADVENEAALAIILGHELSHYYFNDLEASFISKVKASKKKNKSQKGLKTLTFELVHEDRRREGIADTMGFRWALNAGYDINDGIYNFYRFLDNETISENKKRSAKISNVYINEKKDGTKEEKDLYDLLASHPETSERITVLAGYCKKNISGGSNLVKYQVRDESFFKSLQQQARYESLHVLLEELNFADCAEKAFLYHLFDPQNDLYVYYLLESVRRGMYLDRTLYYKGFLSEEYSSYFIAENYSIVRKLNLLIRDEEKLANIKAVDFKDSTSVPFTSYQEAFDYFGKIAIRQNIKEAYLTLALATDNVLRRDSLLTVYLSFDNVSNKNFASRFKDGSLYNSKFKKDLILSEGVAFYNINRYGKTLDIQSTESLNRDYFGNLDYLKKDFPNVEITLVPDVMKKSFADAIELKHAIYSSSVVINHMQVAYMKDEELDLFRLDPSYFELFNRYEIKSLSFLVAKNYDDKREIKNALNLLNPFFYIYLNYYFQYWLINGTKRYEYEIGYLTYDPYSKEKMGYYYSSANYKLTKMHFLNAVYYTLIDE